MEKEYPRLFDNLPETRWSRSYVDAIQVQFPETPESIIHASQRILWQMTSICQPYYNGAYYYLRGSVAKNFISPSVLGPKIPPIFKYITSAMSPKLLDSNPEWKKALNDGADGQDLDVRFNFALGQQPENVISILDNILGSHRVVDNKYFWNPFGQNWYVETRISDISAKTLEEKPRIKWKVIFKNFYGQTLFKMDMGEAAKEVGMFMDSRCGFASSYRDIGAGAWIYKSDFGLVISVDDISLENFYMIDAPIKVTRGDTADNATLLTRIMLNSLLWPNKKTARYNKKRMIWVGGMIDDQLPYWKNRQKRRSEVIGSLLKLEAIDPTEALIGGTKFSTLNYVPLGKLVNQANVRVVLSHIRFPGRWSEPKEDYELFNLTYDYYIRLRKNKIKLKTCGPILILDALKRTKLIRSDAGMETLLMLHDPMMMDENIV